MKLALEKSEAIVVNSRAEADFITRYFSLRKPNIHIVYNGVDFRFESAAPELFVNTYGFSDFLLYVGRIEPRKNILRLLKAFNKAALNTEMIIIGKSVEGPLGAYWRECLKEAAKNRDRIHFLGPLEHSSPLLGSAYAASKTLVLPSFFETPGLSALEGAVAGANVVITKRGATREYFSDFAVYVDPSSVKSIAKGIYKGYHSPRNKNLKRHILENFTWDKSTDQLERAFKSVI
jgi:glycosyltransferase involved in cell wall biosynthesis